MNVAYEIGINLISAAIGTGIGLFLTFGKNTLKYRHQRAFWRFLEKQTVLVVGDLTPEVLLETLPDSLEDMADTQQGRQRFVERVLKHLYTQEISGLIGRGDLDAMVRILDRIGSTRSLRRPLVLHPAHVHEGRTLNLILIGGKDTNSLTRTIAPRMGCQLESLIDTDGHNVIRDSKLGMDYKVTWDAVPNAQGVALRKDYGILARGPNPFNPKSQVLLLAGAHGLGSLAAAEVCLSKEFEKRLYNDFLQFKGNFECLVSYEQVDGGPDDGKVTIDLELSRSLHFPPTNR
jgi:hypothetical protein